jgi:hypothetical protein
MGAIKEQVLRMAASGDLPGHDLEPGSLQFSLSAPKAVVRQVEGRGRAGRPSRPPKDKIIEHRLIAHTDPHVGEGIDTLVDYLIGSGYSIAPVNIVGLAEQVQTDEDIADLKWLIETSPTFETVIYEWVWHALVDGTAFMEIVVEDDVFKPKLLPTESVDIIPDKFGHTMGYVYTGPDGNEQKFKPYDLAVLRFHRTPGEDFGRSLIERIEEAADMLRDMEIDSARFIATKAYPPIIWKLGNEQRTYTQPQIDAWLEKIRHIEPDSMLAVGHDVEHDVVGVSSTSSSQGAMRLEPMFEHLLTRIYTGLGLPAFLGNINQDAGRNEAVSMMPKFDRRIQRYRRIIRDAIRHQVFVSIMAGESDPSTLSLLPPDFEFGKHSSEEERLEASMAIQLVNNGLLTFEAAAKRIGIDPETEMPGDDDLAEHARKIALLAGMGDRVQNPAGGRPTITGAGTGDPSRSVATRQNPERPVTDESRPQRGIEEA